MLLARGGYFGCLRVLLIPFFAFFYGAFTLGHGIIVFVVFGAPSRGYGQDLTWEQAGHLASDLFSNWYLWLSAAALATSHGFSFVSNYVRSGEYLHTDVRNLMLRPFGRVTVLHVTVLLGAYLLMTPGVPVWFGVGASMLLKIGLDAWAHVRERTKLAPR